ncbi:MAG: Ig-like domain-containing protein, partial [Lutisporaceae bacterium]
MKKTLAIILALAMVFSTLTVAFAEETIGVDAQACATLGMLKGNTSAGVTADYVATTPNRIQAALLFLRLKGLEQTALEYTGTDNFVDVDQVNWSGYKAVMAYLKANSQLGFSGIGGDKFDPNAAMGANAYYKVVLTALGYRQDVDFAWADVVTFAASKNLVKVANDASFTVGDLAIATIEGLKATVKDSEKTLVASLIEAGTITEVAAVAAGVYTAPVAVVMTAAKAITNNKFEITLANAVTTAPLASTITVKDSTGKAMTVNNVALSANGKVVTVTTEALTPFTPYAVTVGTVSKNIVALAIDTTKPAAPSVAVTANTSVTVTFAEEMERATAENIANYAIDNSLTVLKAELDSTKKVVTLTTSEQTVGTIYTITVQNAADVAGNVMDKATGYFGGMAKDTTKPAAPSVTVSANTTVTVTFVDEMDKATAENIANYAIDNNLVVLKAELDTDDT